MRLSLLLGTYGWYGHCLPRGHWFIFLTIIVLSHFNLFSSSNIHYPQITLHFLLCISINISLNIPSLFLRYCICHSRSLFHYDTKQMINLIMRIYFLITNTIIVSYLFVITIHLFCQYKLSCLHYMPLSMIILSHIPTTV